MLRICRSQDSYSSTWEENIRFWRGLKPLLRRIPEYQAFEFKSKQNTPSNPTLECSGVHIRRSLHDFLPFPSHAIVLCSLGSPTPLLSAVHPSETIPISAMSSEHIFGTSGTLRAGLVLNCQGAQPTPVELSSKIYYCMWYPMFFFRVISILIHYFPVSETRITIHLFTSDRMTLLRHKFQSSPRPKAQNVF